FFASRRRHTRFSRDWSSDVCSSDLSGGLSDPRVRCIYADGIEHVKENPGAYDVILVDSTEPVGPAAGLFQREFYNSVFNSLREQIGRATCRERVWVVDGAAGGDRRW